MIKKIFFNKSFYIFLILGLVTRFYNLSNRLYFVWDNGRDAWAIDKIIHGDLALIGHTSGIEGFFLDPLWFYLGTLGHLIGNGSPWIISYWYILLTAISIPIFWLLSKELFKNRKWQLLSSYLLLLVPASIRWSSFVWNPMMTIPLMAGTYYSLLRARKSRNYLLLSFFLLALVLQFEFAYGIFFIFTLFLLIPWIRKKFYLKDYLYSGLAIGATLVPQILFELRNKFIMTRAIFKSFSDNSKSVSWLELWAERPKQLVATTRVQLFHNNFLSNLLITISILVIIFGIYLLIKNKLPTGGKKQEKYKYQISFLLLLIPYFFFMLWRGNNGYFFDYYLTPHFVFLIPVLLLIFQKLIKKYKFGLIIFIFFIIGISFSSLKYIKNRVIYVENKAGIKSMNNAIGKLYDWQEKDGIQQGVFRIFTPNTETEHYDYLMHWNAKKNNLPVPHTQKSDQDQYWYILIEPSPNYPPGIEYTPGYAEAIENGKLTRKEDVGALKLESWKRN